MNRWERILIGLILIALTSEVEANHSLGANISYNWLVGNQYEINVNFYRDCFGIPAPDSISICINSISSIYSDSVKIPLMGAIILPQLSYLPPVTSACYGGTGFGIEKNHYSGIITLLAPANDWILSYTTPVHLSSGPLDPERYGYYVSTKIDNINHPQNSSIQFNTDPRFTYCLNVPTWESYSANDSDGDSLIYNIENVLIDTFLCPAQPFINSNNGLSNYFQQLNSTIPYFLDPTDGWMYFQPDVPQMGYISIKVTEFNNGNNINETTFSHFQSAVFNCTSTSIYNLNSSSLFVQIFPNIISDELHIYFDNINSKVRIYIYDIYGKVVSSSTLDGRIKEHSINVAYLSSGLYSLRLNQININANMSKVNTFTFIKTNP